jgi:hypothetical protein
MKKQFYFIIILAVFASFSTVKAQERFDNAVLYLDYIGTFSKQIQKDVLSYSAAVAHDKSARKIENRRQTMLQNIDFASRKINYAVPFNYDKAFRDSVLHFLKLYTYVLKEDYGKIINMEEVSEQSYDAMEAYLLAQDLASNKIKQAGNRLMVAQRDYAKRQNFTLTEGNQDKVDVKSEKAGAVSEYHRQPYLLFFKMYKQDSYLFTAVEEKNVNSIEQNKNTMIKFADETTAKLRKLKAFEGDESLLEACAQYINFSRQEANSVNIITDYLLKEENFNKIVKRFETKKAKERTQEDVDGYNKAVNDYNAAVNSYNANNKDMNTAREKALNTWNKMSQKFLDRHYPKY